MKKVLIVAVHGVITGNFGRTWPDSFEAHAADEIPQARVLKCPYWTMPTPFLNMYAINPLVAHLMASTVKKNWSRDEWDLCFIGHSNGCHVISLMLPILWTAGYQLKTALFIAGAMPSDMGNTPVGQAVGCNHIEKVVALCSAEDSTLRMGARSAYGQFKGRILGNKGWTASGEPVVSTSGKVKTIFRQGFAHSDYFETDPEDFFLQTRQTFYQEAGLK